MSAEEHARFTELNTAYVEKFGSSSSETIPDATKFRLGVAVAVADSTASSNVTIGSNASLRAANQMLGTLLDIFA